MLHLYIVYIFHFFRLNFVHNDISVHNLFILNNSLQFVNNSFCKYVKENNYKNIQKIYIREKIRFGKYFNVNNRGFIFPLFSHDTLIWQATY